jgi:hypothetical protein
MSSAARRQRRSQKETLDPTRRPIGVYVFVYVIIAIMILGLLSLVFSSPQPVTY